MTAAAYRSLREDAVARLTEWPAPNEDQERLRREYLHHLEQHPDAMARSGPPAHLTGSVIVLDESGEHVLLTHHPKARLWLQFGGHFEEGDTSMLAGAAREALEESGIASLVVLPDIVDLSRHALAASFGRCREHLDVRYAAIAPADAGHTVSEESLDVRWWPVGGLPDGAPADLVPLIAEARRVSRR
ncbi:NUDIX hydrolase [Humibacillus xanthopallidus]|uniref:8-oxo-dGTP pyrophosphatase MutT (NUDIX family) n=1 Tax=Humibacillus xanthopallidus TaxID=412689 RepID=A0A543HV96_9MICO|nr:NUDIX domain-containing protein [Humibacillus xanthopallidus]TQM62287.1 8-oxo-dGTP pyrophosphatase MutT (NUDIX family) [Humibacillus xanthopallidus]